VVPALAEVASVGKSCEGNGLGLFARRELSKGDVVHRWSLDSGTVMEPLEALSNAFESEEFGALAFQVLKASRSKDLSPWRLWWAAGVTAPETHPLKLLLSNPQLAQQLWNSTTCGGRMSASALRLRDDLQKLQGGASLEEWAEAVALVMSRCIVEDDDGVPLLVLGLDLLQDGDDPNVEARAEYATTGGLAGLGALGDLTGGGGERRLVGVALTATRAVRAGDELTGRYLEKPHAGRYLERYGFVPQRLRGPLVPACAELSFAPTDADDDFHFGVKQSLLEDVGLSTDPLLFLFGTEDGIAPPQEGREDWEAKSTLDKMVHILRLRHTGGAESYLLDSVYVDDLWYNCNFRISKDNESAVCRTVIDECDRWLERFQSLDDKESSDVIAAAAADVRTAEAEVLQQVRDIFAQELRDTMVDESRTYWADRQLDTLFPQRKGRKGKTGVNFIDDP